MVSMKIFKLIIFYIFLNASFYSQIKLCTWNLENFGKSKIDSSILFIATTLKNMDVIAVEEVVAGNGGAQAIARLHDALNRTGNKWDYCVSNPTTGSPNKIERYAFLWKTSRLKKIGECMLDENFKTEIEREPYMATFIYDTKEFSISALHAIPKDSKPETELKYLQFIPEKYPTKTILFCGDYNCSESHSVFNPLKKLGYSPIITNQKTSLKKECKNNICLASEYDNIFYKNDKIKLIKSGVIHFYTSFETLKEARKISDHLPVFCEFEIK